METAERTASGDTPCRRHLVAGLSAAAFLAAGCSGGALPGFGAPREPAVDALFAAYDHSDSPGCALGVIRDGAFVYRRGYGMANLELGVPIDSSSVFRIGSVSKQFTAMAVLLLEEEGLLTLDDDVRQWLPELPDFGSVITVRHLIGHTSGLRDYLVLTWLSGYRDQDYYVASDLLTLLARQRELNFPPGSEHRYSNSGYFLLGQIVERATGTSLAEAAEARIFAPLGMASTRFYDDTTRIVPRRASGYAPRDDGYQISMTSLPIVGDGGVFTSIEDLRAWDANFYANRLGAGDPGLIERWLEPATLSDGTAVDYSAGIVDGEYRGARTVSHGGAFVGFRADMVRFPEHRFSVAVLCNLSTASPSALARRVADHYLAEVLEPADPAPESAEEGEAGEPEEFLLPVAELRAYEGRYLSPELGVTYVLTLREGRLQLEIAGRRRADIVALERDRLGAADTGIQLRFERDEAGGVTGFALDGGRVTGLWFERLR